MLPTRQQPVYLVAIPVLRNYCFKAVLLQMNCLFGWDGLCYSSINYHIHKLFNNLKTSLWKRFWVFGMIIIAFGNDMRNAKSFFEVFVFLPRITIF